jgi:predicted ATPase
VFFPAGRFSIPATRLSDGTLRYLCLLSILCHPKPPTLVCLEEPELGLHPDVLPTLAELLKEASERSQIIVTTHSDVLVDALTDQPETVLVAERSATGTTLTRLDAEKLRPWLEKYRLGQLWTRGEIGGTRW